MPLNKFGKNTNPEYRLSYDDKNHISSIKFKEPVTLKDASKILMKPEVHDNLDCFNLRVRNIEDLSTSKLADVKVKELLGYGTVACAFLMDNDKVLKLSRGPHSQRKPEKFDIPVYDQGILLWDKPYNIHYYIEEYGDSNKVSKKDAVDLINKIEEQGYSLFDIYSDFTMENICIKQFGKAADGKVYLLDPECVIY